MWISRTRLQSPKHRVIYTKRCDIRLFSVGAERILKPHNRVQAYVSQSLDPYINLSLENYLLQNSGPGTYVLLFYINRPSVIIGRNQNPWLEVNLGLLQRGIPSHEGSSTSNSQFNTVDLIRRRSGGGTVFHDQGNVNWSVICPPASFTRDKHAEMVTRALQSLGKDRVRVNERHDIILLHDATYQTCFDGDSSDSQPLKEETNPRVVQPLKISGSAYKITRSRALHHGTCLLSSPNLEDISSYLKSPAKRYIQARGVESVSSPVGNIGVKSEDFIDATSKEFFKLYESGNSSSKLCEVSPVIDKGTPRDEMLHGYEELKTMAWKYGQTPQFTFSTRAVQRKGPSQLPFFFEDGKVPDFSFKARSGVITESEFTQGRPVKSIATQGNPFINVNLYSVTDWFSVLERLEANIDKHQLSRWLSTHFPAKYMLP